MNFLAKYKIFSKLLEKRKKSQFYLLIILLVFQSILEAAGIGMVIPILSVVFSPEGNLFLEYTKYLLGDNFISQNFLIVTLMLFIFIFFILKSLFLYFCAKKTYDFSFTLQTYLRDKIFKQYLTMSYAEYLNNKSSILIANISANIPLITQFYTIPFISLISESLILFSILLFLLFYEPFGFIILAFILFFTVFLCYKTISKTLKQMGQNKEKLENQMAKVIQKSIGSMKVTKLYNLHDQYLKEFYEQSFSISSIQGKSYVIQNIPRFVLEISGFLVLSVLVFFLLALNEPGTRIVSVLGIFTAAGFKVIPSANRIMFALQGLKYSESVLKTVNNIFLNFDKKSKESKKNTLKENKTIIFEKTIKFKNISFKYDGSNKIILNKLNLDLHKNKKIGIVGSSGVGKTTFLDILVGLIKPRAGTILADNKKISLNNFSWRGRIAYVPQYNYLTEDTLEKNIAFGVQDEKIDFTRVNEVLEITSLKKELLNKSGKYKHIGERGINLSGGQIQRIGIARALYKKPSILIMDEPTSSLDEKNEKIIIEIINKIKNLTLVIVSHRKELLEKCDKIFTLKNGTLIKNT